MPPIPAGDWRRSYAYATALSCWGLLPQKDAVLGMLRAKLQEEGLRTYLLAYGRFYSSLSIAQLCDMFELPDRKVRPCLPDRTKEWGGAGMGAEPRSLQACVGVPWPGQRRGNAPREPYAEAAPTRVPPPDRCTPS